MTQRKINGLTDEEEAEIQAQIAEDPDDWTPTDEELAEAKPFSEALPELYAAIQGSRGRPKLANAKEAVTLRLPPDTVERFRATGPDWRQRMAEALEKVKP
ncbi:MAG: BrnA antitoxin family protein [Devosia sp.]